MSLRAITFVNCPAPLVGVKARRVAATLRASGLDPPRTRHKAAIT